MNNIKIGIAMCGSFCTFELVLPQFEKLKSLGYDLYPIMSEIVYETDTRFGKARDLVTKVETICGKSVIKSITEAEPIGPKKILDILLIAPCTGNTLSKLTNAITDTSVTMAAKAHLRNDRPVLIAVSTNDGLSVNSKNIGSILNQKNIFFVPFSQDDAVNKPTSLVADFEKIPEAVQSALQKKQLQPLF